MKVHYALLLVGLLATTTLAQNDPSLASSSSLLKHQDGSKRLTGAFHIGYDTLYSGRGIVVSHSVAEGDSTGFVALKTNYDIGAKGVWSIDSALAYRVTTSGHTMYGNPNCLPALQTMGGLAASGAPFSAVQLYLPAGVTEGDYNASAQFASGKVKQANIENEFLVSNAIKFSQPQYNISLGHDFIHGGLLGVMAKHYRDQSASCVNEVFIKPEWTPAPWFSLSCTTRYSFQGITGWWFEPQMEFKAPIIGTPEAPKLVGMLTMGMSATADYYQSYYFACANGSQSFWFKLSAPYFVRENFIVTPSVSFNWLGKGSLKANEKSEFRLYTGDKNCVPFRNFAVIGGISCSYTF